MRARLLFALPVLALLLLAGCFDRPLPACAFFCGEGEACPEGYSCAEDGWCKRDDVDPAFRCPNAPSDAAVDAPPAPDASADSGAPDSGVSDGGGPDGSQ